MLQSLIDDMKTLEASGINDLFEGKNHSVR